MVIAGNEAVAKIVVERERISCGTNFISLW
jgi:hypothetical protein